MKGVGRIAALLLLGVGLVALVRGCVPTSHTARYRLTVALDTPWGERRASAVQEVAWREPISVFKGMDFGHVDQSGQALAFDLPDGPLFIPVDADADFFRAASELGAKTGAMDAPDPRVHSGLNYYGPVIAFLRKGGASIVVKTGPPFDPRWERTPFARYRDVNDLQSLQVDDPRPLGAAGRPFRVTQVALEASDAPLTTSVTDRVPGLRGDLRRYRRDPQSAGTTTLPNDTQVLFGMTDF